MAIFRRTTWRRLAPLLAVVLVLCFAAAAMACPTCKEGLAQSDPAYQGMVSGYFYSILFMMAMPFVVLGTFGGFAYLSIRRAREAEALAAEAEQAVSD